MRRQEALVHLAAARRGRSTSGISTPCTPAISMVMDMRPGTITVRNSSATRPRRGRMLPKTSTTRMGWVSVADEEHGSALRDGHQQVAAQQGQEGGHSRSSFPVRWM